MDRSGAALPEDRLIVEQHLKLDAQAQLDALKRQRAQVRRRRVQGGEPAVSWILRLHACLTALPCVISSTKIISFIPRASAMGAPAAVGRVLCDQGMCIRDCMRSVRASMAVPLDLSCVASVSGGCMQGLVGGHSDWGAMAHLTLWPSYLQAQGAAQQRANDVAAVAAQEQPLLI